MKVLRYSTQIHKWVGLVVGIQVLFWVGGGLVMTAIPIETVRSEHRLKSPTPAALLLDQALPLTEIARLSGVAPAKAELKSTQRGPAWILTPVEGAPVTVAAATGRPFAPMTANEAAALAVAAYRGEAAPRPAVLLDPAPKETGREGPIWRVDFQDAERTAFYLSPQTGEVVTRRSAVWRFYDFFWRLHILDFKNGENFNHPLLIGLTLLTLSIVVTGFILLWIRLARDLKTARAVRAARRKAAA
ncbi:PepSY domain-containing protein [Brevundimonas faecalis]|uniref:Iron-regulated membrane protein n=1 Tax=Brevundimonas faecalis TaxID=947378 RepID=A0ABV2RES8_9CAUL